MRLINLTTATVENKYLSQNKVTSAANGLLADYLKKALLVSAFFMLVSSMCLLPAQAQSFCETYTLDNAQAAIVKWVYDGDTLLVTDTNKQNERKVRLIGINTPETAHHQQAEQRYGAKAREALRALLKQHHYKILLEFDKDKHDRYGRELAYTYLTNGKNIAEWLLKQGYATTLVIPPNVKYAQCFKRAEAYAQQQRHKIWQLDSHSIKPVSELVRYKRTQQCYVRLKGRITRLKKTKKWTILELGASSRNSLQLKIHKKNLQYFKQRHLNKLVSQDVIVSGCLRVRKKQWRIHVTYPTQITLAESD